MSSPSLRGGRGGMWRGAGLRWALCLALCVWSVPGAAPAAKPRRASAAGASARPAVPAPPVAVPELEAAHAALLAGRPVEAQDRLRRWLAQGGNEAQLPPTQVDKLQAIRAASLPPTGEVAVSGEAGTEVRIDDQPLAQLPLPLPLLLSAGAHQVVLKGRGGALSAQVQVRAGHRIDVRESREAGAVMLSQPPHALLSLPSPSSGLPLSSDVIRISAEQGLQGTQLYLTASGQELQAKLHECGERPDCLRALAQAQDVEYVLLAQASPGAPPLAAVAPSASPASPAPPAAAPSSESVAVRLRAVLFDARVADQAAAAEASCPSCTPAELASRLRDLVSRVVSQGLGRPRGQLRIESEPEAAELQLNGAAQGPGPIERTVWSGEVAIVASLAGYRPQTLRRFVAEGSQETVRIRLERLPPPPSQAPQVAALPGPAVVPAPRRAPRPLWRLLLGSTAVVAGGLLLGFGAGAQSVDGRCVDGLEPPANQCNRLYQTSTLATSLLVGGAVAVVTGVVLLAIPGPVRPDPPARKGP